MILRDISLDFNFTHENFIAIYDTDYSNENSVDVYQSTWKKIRFDFINKTRCMVAMVCRLMKKVSYGDFRKINVECLAYADSYLKNIGGFLEVGVPFDYSLFVAFSDYEKKKYAIDVLSKAIEQIEAKLNFDMYSVKDAIE